MTHYSVQAPRFTEARKKSDTESARCVANFYSWQFDDDDRVVDADGRRISYTIEDLAAAASSLGWIQNYRVHWSVMPHYSVGREAAEQVHGVLEGDGTFPGRGVSGC